MGEPWPMVPLGAVLSKTGETCAIKPDGTYKEVTVRMWGNGVVLRRHATGAEMAASTRAVVREGHFILSRIDARNGAFGLVPPELDGAVVSNDFPTFELNRARLNAGYLGWMSRTAQFVELCRQASEGTTNRVRLKEDAFLRMLVPLPPTEEQRRIVARVDAIAAKVEEAQRLRHAAADQAQALHARLGADAYDNAASEFGCARLAEVCRQITDGTHSTPTYVESGVPFLSVKDVTTGQISFQGVRFITHEEHAELKRRCDPKPGDVLLTKIGTTGVAKVIDVDREFSIFVSLALLKLDSSVLEPHFVEAMLNSPRIRALSKEGTRGVGNQNLVLKFIREFPIPIPPVPEQKRIVQALRQRQALIGRLAHDQERTNDELNALLPAVLDSAFRGEL